MTINYIKKKAVAPVKGVSGYAAQPMAHSGSGVQLDGVGVHEKEVFKVVAKYLQQDFHILPINRKKGYCVLKKEQQTAFTCSLLEIESKFKGMDVGVDLWSSGLVGVDVDCLEVVEFLQKLLPPTCVVGREGKATSWMIYRLTGMIPKNLSFQGCDENGEVNGELGGLKVNAVVALPPTRHRKTQEVLTWTSVADPALIEAQQFVKIIGTCFAMALIARHWPGPGNRHEPTLALAGCLARAGMSFAEAKAAVRVLASVTGDAKLDERLNEVKSTYDHHLKGESTTGLPRLVKLLAATSGVQSYLEQNLKKWLCPNGASNTHEDIGSATGQSKSLSKYALSLGELMGMELPEQEFIVYPWLPLQALVMLFAARGVGKTWAGLELAISVALGRDYFAWTVPKPRRVLFIDGEMPLNSLKTRLKMLLGTTPSPPDLKIISSELLLRDNAPLNISQPHQQQRIDDLLNEMKVLGKAPDLIILDNLSSLVTGIDENSNSDLDQFLQWLVKLRSQGYSVMAVHHAGKNGDQRGGSRREDLLDTVVKLEKRESLNLVTTEGACFEISFTKLRGELFKPKSLVVALTTDGNGNHQWKHEEGHKQPAYMNIVQGIHEHKPVSQVELSEKLGCSRQHISTQVNACIDKGLLKKKGPHNKTGLSLTPKGLEAVAALAVNPQDMSAYEGMI